MPVSAMLRSLGSPPICDARAPTARLGPVSSVRSPRSVTRQPRHERDVSGPGVMTSFEINGRADSVRTPEDAPLLCAIRDELGLKGTKFGCGIGLCGACTVHVAGRATRSWTLLQDFPDPTD